MPCHFNSFCPLLNVYLNSMKIKSSLYLSISLRRTTLSCDFFRNRRNQEKVRLYSCFSCSMVCKIFFCSEFADVPEKSWRGKKTNRKEIAKRYALEANGITLRCKLTFYCLCKLVMASFNLKKCREDYSWYVIALGKHTLNLTTISGNTLFVQICSQNSKLAV